MKKQVFIIAIIIAMVLVGCGPKSSGDKGDPNSLPKIFSVIASPRVIETGGQTKVDCLVSDKDGDFLSFSWKPGEGKISGSDAGSTIQWIAPTQVGDYTIQCVVSDGTPGVIISKGVVVTVIPPNHPPTISSVLANPASIETGKQSSISCQASDPDNDPLTYSWSANAGTFTGSGSAVQWTAPISAGTYAIQCAVSDGRGGSASKSASVIVTGPPPPPPPINHPPVISSVLATPASIETGKQSSISCQASDPDNDPLTYSWSANAGTFTGSASTVQWTAPISAGTFTLQCEVSDGRGGSASKSVSVTATGPPPPPPPINHPPVISSVLATPASIETGKQSSISCQASDPDNDSLTFSWSANAGTFTGSASTVQWTAPAQAGNFVIQCSVSDGRLGSASGTTDITVIIPIPVKWTLPQGLVIGSVATDQITGELYAAGRTNIRPTDIFLAKFNLNGTIAWMNQWGTAECDNLWRIIVFNHEIFVSWSGNDIYCLGGGNEKVSRFDAAGSEINTFLVGHDIGAVDATNIYYRDSAKTDYQGVLSWGPPFPWVMYSVEDVSVRNGIAYYVGQSANPGDLIAEGYTAAVDVSINVVVWTSRWGSQTTASGHKVAANVSGIYTFGENLLVVRHDFAGNVLWTYQDIIRSGTFSFFATDDTAVYAMGGTYNGCGLTKINNDGTLAWQTSVVGWSLALFNNVLFVADGTNVIHRYDALTGLALP